MNLPFELSEDLLNDGENTMLELEREEYLRDTQIESTQFGVNQPDLK